MIYGNQISKTDCRSYNYINRQNGFTSPNVSNRLTGLRHNTLNLIIGLLKGSIKLKGV